MQTAHARRPWEITIEVSPTTDFRPPAGSMMGFNSYYIRFPRSIGRRTMKSEITECNFEKGFPPEAVAPS